MHSWKLSPCYARDDEARICFDGLKSVPTIIDREEDVNGYSNRRNLERHSACAIRTYCIGARYGHLKYVAVLA